MKEELPRILDRSEATRGKLMDAACLAKLDGLARHQMRSDSNRAHTGQNIGCQILFVYAARGDHGDLRIWCFEGLDIFWPTHLRTGKNLDEINAFFPRMHDLRRSEYTGDYHDLLMVCKGYDIDVQPSAR